MLIFNRNNHFHGLFLFTWNEGVRNEENIAFLKMPYSGNDFAMYIYLPLENSSTAVDDLLSKLTIKTLEGLQGGKRSYVDVKFPKMSIKSDFMLESVSSSRPMSGSADNVDLSFDDIIHKAVIKVDEKGTIAAAASASTGRGSIFEGKTDQFYCDHPFVFVVYDTKSDQNIVSGVYRGPSADQSLEISPRDTNNLAMEV